MIDQRTADERLRDAMALQRIEGNPFNAEDIAMIEMFEREGWTDDQCRAFLKAKFQEDDGAPLAR